MIQRTIETKTAASVHKSAANPCRRPGMWRHTHTCTRRIGVGTCVKQAREGNDWRAACFGHTAERLGVPAQQLCTPPLTNRHSRVQDSQVDYTRGLTSAQNTSYARWLRPSGSQEGTSHNLAPSSTEQTADRREGEGTQTRFNATNQAGRQAMPHGHRGGYQHDGRAGPAAVGCSC